MPCIRVGDTRYAGAKSANPIWEEPHRRPRFGDLSSVGALSDRTLGGVLQGHPAAPRAGQE